MKKKVIVFGYNKNSTKITEYIKDIDNYKFQFRKKINYKMSFSNFNLIVLYGYRKIVRKTFIEKYRNKLVNLHISYLPYNRGAYPNYWSWVNKTPHGVSIHRVSSKVDSGSILYQKKVKIPLKNMTFKKSYEVLRFEMDKLFSTKLSNILKQRYKLTKQKKIKQLFHKKKDLPNDVKKNWNIPIRVYLNKLK
jgi:methionyl-tRNA formyltransferase